MLCGRPPFNGNTEKKVLEKVVKGLYEFKDSEWEGVSENAKDLIRKLLEYSPEKRLSADEALNHPWFRSTLGESRITNKSMVIKNLKNFQNFKVSIGFYGLSDIDSLKKNYKKLFGCFW